MKKTFDVQPLFHQPTPAAKKAGIFANITIRLVDGEDRTFATLKNICIRWTPRKSKYYLSVPSQKGIDKQGKTTYYDYFSFFPGKENYEHSQKFLGWLIAEARKSGLDIPDQPDVAVVSKPAAKSSAEDDDDTPF